MTECKPRSCIPGANAGILGCGPWMTGYWFPSPVGCSPTVHGTALLSPQEQGPAYLVISMQIFNFPLLQHAT